MKLVTHLYLFFPSSPLRVALTASVYFHRFYIKKRVSDAAPQDMIMACFFLATKVEETPIRVRKLVNYIFRVKYQTDQELEDDSSDYKLIKDRLLANEELLLETIGFDMLVPNSCVVMDSYMRFLNCTGKIHLYRMAFHLILDR
jgi:hypothetical protein